MLFDMKKINRRRFIQNTSLSTAALGMVGLEGFTTPPVASAEGAYLGDFAAAAMPTVRAAFIGLGHRGKGHVKNFSGLPNTEVVALSDLYEDNVNRSEQLVFEQQPKHPKGIKKYFGAATLWRKMLDETKPDVVFISTNWSNHAPMAIGTLEANAHAFAEVPLAVTVDELWAIVNAAEKAQKHCMMMENVNYSRDELLFLNMCRQGVLGDLLHGEAAYIHELRWQMEEQERGTGSWRTHHYSKRNGNLYPTHGLGPVAQYMNLARGEDTFSSLVSFSTPALGRKAYAEKNYPEDHKWNQLDFKGGDLNTSIVKTHLGRTIMIQWDETSPRPYSRLNLIQGTKGALAGFPTRVALEGGVLGITKDHHRWVEGEALATVYEKYDHPLYKRLNSQAKGSGHGGMDGIMMFRIVECLHQGLPLDQNLYEGCFWSAVAPLSEAAVAQGGQVQAFPDFTRGHWKTTKPLEIIS